MRGYQTESKTRLGNEKKYSFPFTSETGECTLPAMHNVLQASCMQPARASRKRHDVIDAAPNGSSAHAAAAERRPTAHLSRGAATRRCEGGRAGEGTRARTQLYRCVLTHVNTDSACEKVHM